MKDKSESQKPNEMGSTETFLKKYGEMWTQSSGTDSESLTAQFRQRIASEKIVESKVTVLPTRNWAPVWITAAAACVLAVLMFPDYWNRTVGEVVYSSGVVSIAHASMNQPILKSGTRIDVGEDGEAMVSMDSTRIDLFLNRDTAVSLDSSDTVTLTRGDLWVRVDTDSGHFEIETPHGRVQVHGTTFGVSVTDEETQVEIAAGKITVETEAGSAFLEPGEGANLSRNNSAPAIHPSPGDVTPKWARETLTRVWSAHELRYFPSAAPR